MTTNVTLVMAYYDNPKMLDRQFATIRALSSNLKYLLRVIIVDDASPRWPAKPQDLDSVDLRMFRMRVDVPWNQDACRNIGMKNVKTEWALLTDIDHIVPEGTWRTVLLNDWDMETVYNFHRVEEPEMRSCKRHLNSFLLTKNKFYQAGCYDERFAGLYQDHDLRSRLIPIAEFEMIADPIISVPTSVISDANTTTYERKIDEIAIASIKQHRGTQRPIRYQFAYDRVW